MRRPVAADLGGSAGAPPCTGAPSGSDTGGLAGYPGQGSAAYGLGYSYDALNRITEDIEGYIAYGDPAHADAATEAFMDGTDWSASYDAAGNMTCRAATSATTCAGSSPTGAVLSYDNEGRLSGWQNTPTAPTTTIQYLYDGEGNCVQQVVGVSGTTTCC